MINFMLLIDGWLSSAKDGFMGLFESGLRTITFGLAKLIYRAIISVYNIFERLCHGRLLDDEMLNAFSERIGLVLGLVMVFIVLSSLLKMVLDPDKISDKEMGGFALVKKAILVIVMLGISNFMFSFLYTFQKIVVDEHIISRLLLPVNLDQNSLESFGGILAEELFISFYNVKAEEGSTEQIVQDCEGYFGEFRNNIIRYGNFELGYVCLNESVVDNGLGIETYVMDYNWLLLIVVGVVVLFLLVSYCISIGIRMVQLMFLEIIAPMAIVSYMAPKKDTMFSKWLKIYISTYIDVFIRIAIINFVVFIIATILDAEREGFMFWQTVGNEGTTMERGFIFAVIVIALLTFAKKAPDLLKDLIGSNASKLGFGVNSPKQIFDGMLGGSTIRKGVTTGAKVATAGTAIGLLSSIASGTSRYRENKKLGATTGKAAGAAAFGALTALGSGLMYGGKNGFKGMKKGLAAQTERDNKYVNLIRKGGTLTGALSAKASDMFGDSEATKDSLMLENIGTSAGYLKDAKAAADEMFFVQQAKETWEKAVQWEGESQEAFNARRELYRKAYKNLQKAAINYVLTGDKTGLEYTNEIREKVQKRDDNGNPIEGEFEEQIRYETKNYSTEIAGDHDSSLAYKKIENAFSKTMTITENRQIEYYDQDGNVHKLKFETPEDGASEEEIKEIQKKNYDLFMTLGDKSADTEYVVGVKGAEIHKAEADYVGVKTNSSNDKK